MLLERSDSELLKLREHERERVRDDLAQPSRSRHVPLAGAASLRCCGRERDVAFTEDAFAARRAHYGREAVLH